MLLYLLITCVPFFLFLKSLLFSLLPWPNPSETRISSPPLLLFFKHIFSSLSSPKPKPNTNMPLTKKKALTATATSSSGAEEVTAAETSTSLLDLPELALDCILERLPPEALCGMAGVCASMRERCLSDRLWERHMRHKWGRVVGQAAHREWQWHVASRPAGGLMGSLKPGGGKQKGGLVRNILSLGWPFSWMMRSKVACDDNNNNNNNSNNYNNNGNNNSNGNSVMALPVDSIMAWYLALETGKFCFPAQVYNRENGHVGFMLSCYDAQISYDPKTDTFQARYPPHGRRAMAIESSVPWERLRAPPVETPPHDLHISDCLHELCPGDHIEIQWRRNKEFPYGWWYGMVGHLESCDGNENYCRCQDSDTVVLDFNQYTPGSRWRHTTVSRKDHREEGNEADGFYGGIRKLNKDDEISTWRQLWPTETLD